MKFGFRVSSFGTISLLTLLAALGTVRPACAEFQYDTSFNNLGLQAHIVFDEPSLLTSSTTVTSFLVATINKGSVIDEVLGPQAGDTCVYDGGKASISGPCLALDFTYNGDAAAFGLGSSFTSTGTYNLNGSGTLTISAVPEPSSVVLLLSLAAAAGLAMRARLRSRSAAS